MAHLLIANREFDRLRQRCRFGPDRVGRQRQRSGCRRDEQKPNNLPQYPHDPPPFRSASFNPPGFDHQMAATKNQEHKQRLHQFTSVVQLGH
jgi:hypothetical protein